MNLKELKEKKATELAGIAKDLGVENANRLKKEALAIKIRQAEAEKQKELVRKLRRIKISQKISLFFFTFRSRSRIRLYHKPFQIHWIEPTYRRPGFHK